MFRFILNCKDRRKLNALKILKCQAALNKYCHFLIHPQVIVIENSFYSELNVLRVKNNLNFSIKIVTGIMKKF